MIAALIAAPCVHPRLFFWVLAAFPAGVFGGDACALCGAGQPPFDRGAAVPVPGGWRAVPVQDGSV